MPTPVQIQPTDIDGVLEIRSKRFDDERGYFIELCNQDMLKAAGFHQTFMQDCLSKSRKGTLRGMHYQIEPHGMGKLIHVMHGAIFDVAVDLRRGSPTFSKWIGRELRAEDPTALWVPPGFAHGFIALEDETLVFYKCNATHQPEAERTLSYKDPTVGIRWPMEPTIVNPRDEQAPLLDQAEFNFSYK